MNTDRELMQQALEALDGVEALLTSMDVTHLLIYGEVDNAITALRERLAQPNEFNPDWDAMAVMVEEQQRMATEIDNLKRRLKSVNTAAMRLTSDLTCMEVDDDERLDRDRVMERVMRWRNEWDKAMHNNQSQMQPCAGRNCGSTNPNLHSAECFEDYEKATGMAQPEQGPMKHGGRPMTLRECMEAEEPAQPEQEPVFDCPRCGHCCPQRTWVGLTDEEISNIWCKVSNTDFVTADTHEFARAIEAKLKERNT